MTSINNLIHKIIMKLNESIKVFEKYFNGDISKDPELFESHNHRYVELLINGMKVLVYPYFIHVESTEMYIDLDNDDDELTLESLLSNAAEVLKDILNGNPSKTTRVNLALNKVKELIGNELVTSITRSNLNEGLLIIDCFYEDGLDLKKLKSLKDTYCNNLFYDKSINSDIYLFSIKLEVL